MQSVIRIGLTGGIGSGKSTVASILRTAGAAVIDSDAISRRSTAPGGSAIDDIRRQFGHDLITADGALDRDKMRQRVFSDPDERKRLEAIVHPVVQRETQQQAHAAIEAGHRVIVFDVPLLVESAHWRGRVDKVLVIDCTPEVQVERTLQRSGLPAQAVVQIMASQASRELRLKAADLVIFNALVTLDELAVQVKQAAHRFGL
jgi:dephospho-CoA kinase